MRQRKVSQLLLLLTAEDLDEFRTYLKNPAIRSNKTLLSFLDQFRKKVLPLAEGEDCSVEELINGTDINPRRVDKLSSALYNLTRQFLAQKQFLQDEHAQLRMLAQAIEDRQAGHKELERLYDRLYQQVSEAPRGAEALANTLRLRWLRAEAAILSRGTRSLWQEDFRDLHQLLDQYYHLQKLRLYSATTNARNIYNHPAAEQNPLFHPQEADLTAMDDGPIFRAYILAIRMLREEEETGRKLFLELLDLLDREAPQFSHREGMELYGYALNFSIWNINLGQPEFLEHASTIYLQLLANRLILQRGVFPPTQFKNIVSLHCRLGKVDWVESFIADYGDLLPPEKRAFALDYNRAVLAFHKRDYALAISRFRAVIHTLNDDVFYGIDARVFLWKSYFEHYDVLTRDQVDDMYRLYDAFRLFIERNDKISTGHKLTYRNFIRAFKRFMEILRVDPLRGDHLDELRQHVTETDPFSNKRWMLEKIDLKLSETDLPA
ncbi:MAG: hypothetical protein AAF998_13215 [Bacteroidota bacterium]